MRTTYLFLVGMIATAMPDASLMAQNAPALDRVDVTRWSLSHGRLDRLRLPGLYSPANPKGAYIYGISPPPVDPNGNPVTTVPGYTAIPTPTNPDGGLPPGVLSLIAASPTPLRITLDNDGDGEADDPEDNALVMAGVLIPSCFSLVVAEGAPPPNAVSLFWNAPIPLNGSGNFYATVSIPNADPKRNIVAGQQLITRLQHESYIANSVIYEAPDVGNVIVDNELDGGTTQLSVYSYAGGDTRTRRPRSGIQSRRVGYANPIALEIVEVKQALNEYGRQRVWVRADISPLFEPIATTRIRWAVEGNTGTRIADVVGTNAFAFDIPLAPPPQPERIDAEVEERLVKVTAVATSAGPGLVPIVAPLPFVNPVPPQRQSVGLSTFHSTGCTLSDTEAIKIKLVDELEHDCERSILILLDASGSMSNDGKMAKAKAAASRVLTRLGPGTEVALIVFYSCGNIKVEHEFTTEHSRVVAILPRIKPSGGTPLAAATRYGKDYLRNHARGKSRELIILSDGQETCGGDPVLEASR